jgi:hypothetical protein
LADSAHKLINFPKETKSSTLRCPLSTPCLSYFPRLSENMDHSWGGTQLETAKQQVLPSITSSEGCNWCNCKNGTIGTSISSLRFVAASSSDACLLVQRDHTFAAWHGRISPPYIHPASALHPPQLLHRFLFTVERTLARTDTSEAS